MKTFKYPFRLGRKQNRAILNADSEEVVIFPKGSEELAELTVKLYNSWYEDLLKSCENDIGEY